MRYRHLTFLGRIGLWNLHRSCITKILESDDVFRRSCRILWMCLAVGVLLNTAQGAELKPGTLEAWKRYQSLTEQRIAGELTAGENFLVQDFMPAKEREECRREVAAGRSCILQMRTRTPGDKKIEVPDGLIHHWMGSIRIPGARLNELLEWLQNYDEHEHYFKEVEKSRLISRAGDVFRIFMRLKRKKFITVHYNTEHEVLYRLHDDKRISSTSRASRIAELDKAGTPEESEKPAGNDSGYLWRLNAYWRYQQVGDDVVMSCESISLSRSLPWLVGWAIKGIVNSVPSESLESTLTGIRDGFTKAASSQK